MASREIRVAASWDTTKGIWASPENGTVGLVEQSEVGGHLIIWENFQKEGLPLAITHKGIQLPRNKNDCEYRFISWNDLYSLVEAHKAK